MKTRKLDVVVFEDHEGLWVLGYKVMKDIATGSKEVLLESSKK